MASEAHDDNSWKAIVVMTVCLLVATAFVGLRFYVRWTIVKKLGSDDQVLAATLVLLAFLLPSSFATMSIGCEHRSQCHNCI